MALIHGGPGAAGEMAPVAKELSSLGGILEPHQTKKSIEGQLIELKAILEREAKTPVILVGFSWGAWLSFMFTAKYPDLVKKLILISSGPFEESYTKNMMSARLSHLNQGEKEEVEMLMANLKSSLPDEKNALFGRLGNLLSKAESFDPLTDQKVELVARFDIYEAIWQEAKSLRASGKLLQFGHEIKCPVVAIHGDFDPHDPKGVEEPLSSILNNFRFILLKNCGHYPWLERQAKEQFYKILKQEIS